MSWDEINRELEGITLEQREIIRRLMEEVRLDDRVLDQATVFLSGMPSATDAEQFIYYLNDMKPDRVDSGYNYSQTDITWKLLNENFK